VRLRGSSAWRAPPRHPARPACKVAMSPPCSRPAAGRSRGQSRRVQARLRGSQRARRPRAALQPLVQRRAQLRVHQARQAALACLRAWPATCSERQHAASSASSLEGGRAAARGAAASGTGARAERTLCAAASCAPARLVGCTERLHAAPHRRQARQALDGERPVQGGQVDCGLHRAHPAQRRRKGAEVACEPVADLRDAGHVWRRSRRVPRVAAHRVQEHAHAMPLQCLSRALTLSRSLQRKSSARNSRASQAGSARRSCREAGELAAWALLQLFSDRVLCRIRDGPAARRAALPPASAEPVAAGRRTALHCSPTPHQSRRRMHQMLCPCRCAYLSVQRARPLQRTQSTHAVFCSTTTLSLVQG